MVTVAKRFAAAACVCWAVFALAPPASAGARVYNARLSPIFNPNPYIAPGVSLQQYAYNVAVLGKAYRQVPPYLLGYNPYPLAVNYGPVYNPQVFRPAVYNPTTPSMYGPVVAPGVPYAGGGYGPYYGGNAYNGGYSAGGIDPLTGQPITGGYTPVTGGGGYTNQVGANGWNPYSGGYNYGTAAELEAYGKLGMDQEKARILREQAEQAKLDTRKKLIDTLAYIRANEYTFTQQQADIAKKVLDRVQKMPTQQEITSGKSLNIMTEELGKLAGATVRGPTVNLDEDVLKLLNVTSPGGSGNIGLLRDNGRFSWPSVFDEKNVATEKDKKDLELHAQELFQQAINAKIDENRLKDLKTGLRSLREALVKNVNQVPTQSFTDGLRFLDAFDAAVVALKNGDAPLNLDFQQKFAKGGKTVQELVEYMTLKGLRFAPANAGDERGYQALQAALSANSLAVSSQIASGAKKQ